MPAGRPSEFTQEIADAICEKIADGESLRSICLSEEMPGRSTVFRWLAENKTFQHQYARAREEQADALFDEILQIADDGLNDTYTDDDGNVRTNQDVIARSRLRVDSRKWMAGKLRPKKYGERLELAGDPDAPLEVNATLDVSKLSTQALSEILALRDAAKSS
jgi:hypothetical protein